MYFQHGYSKDKLAALYFLYRFREDIALDTFAGIMSDNEWIPYLELKGCVGDLESAGLVAALPCEFGQSYRITESGDAMVEMFMTQLPFSYRKAMDDYIDANRERLRRESQYITDWEKQFDGTYLVSLKVVEGHRVLLNTAILVPDQAAAERARSRWHEKAQVLYLSTLNELIGDDKESVSESKDDGRHGNDE